MVDARLFQALSDPTRLKILLLLSDTPMNVSSMVSHLKCAQPAVSRHLRVLRETSLIHDTRKGKEVEYSLNQDRLRDAKLYLEALGGGGGQARAEAAIEPAGPQPKPKKVKTGARPKRRARPASQKGTSRVSSEDMPDFVVEREEEESMDDFLL